jgi:hypothetical protein
MEFEFKSLVLFVFGKTKRKKKENLTAAGPPIFFPQRPTYLLSAAARVPPPPFLFPVVGDTPTPPVSAHFSFLLLPSFPLLRSVNRGSAAPAHLPSLSFHL